jgi:3-methyladenine DNA glycosylase AlkD
VYSYGIATGDLRRILGELYRLVRKAWGVPEALAFAECLLAERGIEERTLGIELLGRFHRTFTPQVLKRARRWLARNRCDNWALTDDLSIRVLAPLLVRLPRLVQALEGWGRSPNLWVRRAAAVSLVPLARRGEHLDASYRVATTLLADRADLVRKATGWLLREAGKNDPARLEAYLLRQGARASRTTLRYAIERFPAAQRRLLLARTRATKRQRG